MKKGIVMLMCVALMLAGCADKEHWASYYAQDEKRTDAIIEALKAQQNENRRSRGDMMAKYSAAMTAAAKTPSTTDDAVMAFAWGWATGQKDEIVIPKLSPLKPPDNTSDIWTSIVPVLSLAAPFLYPLTYGVGGSGNSYSASDNAKINIQSENSGSLNSARGDQTLTATDNRIQYERDCIDCEDSGGAIGTETFPGEIDPENPIEPGGETCETTGGFLGPDGRIYADPGFTCSCGSRAAGNC